MAASDLRRLHDQIPPAISFLTGDYIDKGYRGHDSPKPRSIFISGQKRGVFGIIKHELRLRSAIEPIIGHMKTEGHSDRAS